VTSGRPARLQKREETAPAIEPAVSPSSGGRPPRLSKQSAPQADEALKPEAPPIPEVAALAPETVPATAELVEPGETEPAMESPVSSRKRKLRGIRIKNLNEDSEK